MTEDLIAFVRARLDETAARAEAAQANAWYQAEDLERQGFESADARLITYDADPARVLREVEAKRGVLAIYDQMTADAANSRAIVSSPGRIGLTVLKPVLCHMARAWADHPDYRADEWKAIT
jgi:hypothetical protein